MPRRSSCRGTTKLAATVVVRSAIDGSVRVDGGPACRITEDQEQQWELPEGPHEIQLFVEGRPRWSEAATVTEGETRSITIQARAELPPGLEDTFGVVAEEMDRHGNPIRKGLDNRLGWPVEVRHKATGMHFVHVPRMDFRMGSPMSAAEVARKYGGSESAYLHEHPQHKVILARPSYIGKYQVTQTEWRRLMGAEPWKDKVGAGRTGDAAASYLAWADCERFVANLRERFGGSKGLRFALPTEAQWECACQAGRNAAFCFGSDASKLAEYAWIADATENSGVDHVQEVGRKRPNVWGLYDMHGNVWEWCEDAWHDSHRGAPTDGRAWEDESDHDGHVLRGGSWGDSPSRCRCSYRAAGYPRYVCSHFGFRVALRDF